MKETINWLLNNSHILEIIIGVFAAMISSVTFAKFFKRKTADTHLAKLLESERLYLDSKFKELKVNKDEQLNLLLSKDISKEYDLKAIEIKKYLLERELEMLKLEILKQKLSTLTLKLSEKEQNEVKDAINQPTIIGQINYLNNILHQSGSTENIVIKTEK